MNVNEKKKTNIEKLQHAGKTYSRLGRDTTISTLATTTATLKRYIYKTI